MTLILALSAGALGAQDGGGATIPCAVPLTWYLDSVDPRFGFTREEVATAVEEAAELWEDAVGSAILPRDPSEGLPVRLHYDGRQETLQRRLEREGELQDAARVIDEGRADLEARNLALERDHAAHTRRVEALLGRIRRHQDEVARAQRGDPLAEEERAALRQRGEALMEEQRTLRTAAEELVLREEELVARTRSLNQAIEERNQGVLELRRDFPPTTPEAGRYDEQVERRNGRVRRVARSITLFRFADRDALVRVAAHEFGHALGLGHAEHPDAVMSALTGAAGPTWLHPQDRTLLARRCPGL